jgi:hypothetical protein
MIRKVRDSQLKVEHEHFSLHNYIFNCSSCIVSVVALYTPVLIHYVDNF